MFNRFYNISNCIYKTKNILLSFPIRSILKGGSKTSKNKSKYDSQRLRDVKQKINNGNNGSSKKENGPKQPEGDKNNNDAYGYTVAGALLSYGLVCTARDISRLNTLTVLTQKEFETEYLLNGEVRVVNIPGIITSFLTNVQAEVKLYPDEGKEERIIGIRTASKSELINQIRKLETQLGVSRNESIRITLDYNDLFIFFGVCLAQWLVIKRRILPMMPKFESHSSVKPEGKGFRFEIKVGKDNKKNLMDEMNKKFGTDATHHKAQPKPGTTNNFFEFLTGSIVEEYHEKSDIKFKDVAGLHSAKQEVIEFLEYLNNPARFIRLGARLPRGAMLLGPPGCGKTLLVKALANESNVPFFYKAGSEFVDVIGGVGAQKMRKLFATARQSAPAIIFIDEIDAIGKKRGQNMEQAGGDFDQTLNQLLVEMDGMDPNAGIVVFAATNRAEVLDQALIRPGRLDRHISIDLPVLEERKEIFHLYLKGFKDNLEGDILQLKDRMALQTPGMTGADIANLCNEAALTAAKLNYKIITSDCFDIALERIIAGAAKKNKILNENERKVVAYHEAGHALLGWLLKYADPVLKVSIVPRTNAALGFTQLTPTEKYLLTSEILTDRITVLLGGRAAEFIIFNRITSGAHDDLRKVKQIAFSMIRELGMSEKLGNLSFQVTEEDEQYGSYPYSKNTRELIESEANLIVASAYKRAESVLRSNLDKLELLAQQLLDKEVLKNTDIQSLIGDRPSLVTQ